jgi:hypothetical protein
VFPRQKTALFLLLFLAAVLGVRLWNWSDVFVSGRVFFVDADCYSRMTRVRMLESHPWQIIRHHDFENAPQGVTPHTTMPLDWIIAIADCGLRIAERWLPPGITRLDFAGAWISPLLGLACAAWLWWWSRRGDGKTSSGAFTALRAMALVLFAISPILVHAFALGRPDHQSLILCLVAVALGCEWMNSQRISLKCPLAAGVAWGLALWVSLYEPLILFCAAFVGVLIQNPRAALSRERLAGHAATGGIVSLSLLIEGWRVGVPGGADFNRWAASIGELASVPLLSATWPRWIGWGIVLLPLVVFPRAMRFWLVLVVATFALTMWQARWGCFFVLVAIMAACAFSGLPRKASSFGKRWQRALLQTAAWILFVASLWPLARDWDARLDSDQRRLRKADNLALRLAADSIQSAISNRQSAIILAPWWQSPALAYWTGAHCVAGSSHESLPGTDDSARFFLAADFNEARELARQRGVAWVVSSNADNTIENSAAILGVTPPPLPLARVLSERPHSTPPWLTLVHSNSLLKVYRAAP